MNTKPGFGKKTLLPAVAFVAAASITVGAMPGEAGADSFPQDREITLLVGFSAGGGVDAISRLVAKYGEEYWGQDVAVVNRPGGGGQISWNELVRSDSDGYTIAAAVIPNIVYQPGLRDDDEPGYQLDDLAHLGMVAPLPTALYVNPEAPFQTTDELVETLRENPRSVTIGVIGPATVTDGFRVLLENDAGIEFERVIYEGGAPLLQDLMGGHVDVMTSNAMYAVTHEDSVTTLGVAANDRFVLAPDVPTFAEQGYEIEDYVIRGFVAPAGTPDDVLQHLREGLQQIVQDEDFLEEAEAAGFIIDFMDAEETTAYATRLAEERQHVIEAFSSARQ